MQRPYHAARFAVLVAGALYAVVAGATPTFAPARNLPTNTLSGAVIVGDFNGDGKADLFAVNFTTASMFLGIGDGTFTQIAAPVLSANASLGVTGDFNGDGKLDIVVDNFGASNVFVLLGRGDGTFNPAVAVPTGLHPVGIATLDLDGDGKLDLVVSNNGANTVSVLFGNGDGTFRQGATYPAGREPRSLAMGDVNGDGHPDIIVPNFLDNTVSVLLGNGDGTFHAGGTFAAGIGPHAVIAADLNGDGKLDLVVTDNSGGAISVLIGNGDGTFAAPRSYPVGAQPRYVAVADFDGDGKLDLAVTSNALNLVAIFAGSGDGTFAEAVNFPTGATPNDVKAVDFNGDGKLDLVVSNFGGASISILINQSQCVVPGCPGYVGGSVVEFYNSILDNYFITATPAEQLAVSHGAAGPGWAATGDVFRAGGPLLVCRFYGSLSPGPNSHFYTIDPAECEGLKQLQAVTPISQQRWNFESNDFASSSPVAGQCAAGQLPVYRAYNNGSTRGIDSNHRITANHASYLAQVANGWRGEGVVMCAPAN